MPRTVPGSAPGRWAASALVTVCLGACTGTPVSSSGEAGSPLLRLPTPPTDTAAESVANVTGEAIAGHARQMVGVPYLYAGESPLGFDCSGLVQYAHQQAGISVPRTSRAQLNAARQISLHEVLPGDLLFFRSRNFSHVAVYLGDNLFVHAPSSGKKVSTASLRSDYYRSHLVAVGRLH